MADQIWIQQTNRKETMARALTTLTVGCSILLIGAGWWFEQSTKTPTLSMHELQALAAQPLPSIAPPPQSVPTESAPTQSALSTATHLTLQDKPEITTQYEPPAVTIQPILPPKAAPVVKPPRPAPATDSNTPSQPPKTATEITPKPALNRVSSDASEGWIYAGQFIDGTWVERGLVIDEKLPAAGQRYALNWGANIRSEPPGKHVSLGETIGYLAQGYKVDVLEVKKSGSKGHVWIKIKH